MIDINCQADSGPGNIGFDQPGATMEYAPLRVVRTLVALLVRDGSREGGFMTDELISSKHAPPRHFQRVKTKIL